jgi:hypothetical protein
VHPCHRIGDVRHHPHTMTIRFVSEFAEPSEHYPAGASCPAASRKWITTQTTRRHARIAHYR